MLIELIYITNDGNIENSFIGMMEKISSNKIIISVLHDFNNTHFERASIKAVVVNLLLFISSGQIFSKICESFSVNLSFLINF